MRKPGLVLAVLLGIAGCKDSDGDGSRDKRDCAPNDHTIHPDAREVCDGVDNDCNGQIDEDVAITAYLDRDGDGFGDETMVRRVCELPDDGSTEAGDCDDLDPRVNPGAAEICDGLDQDCDAEVDEGTALTFYADGDGDGHGVPTPTTEACYAPEGYAPAADDCDDDEPLAWTGAADVCDQVDNDCDGDVDEDLDQVRLWEDADGDGYGDPALPTVGCGPGPGVSDNALDCDDADPARSPDAIETRGNAFDEDCDGYVDEFGVGPGNEFPTVDDALQTAPDGSVVQLDDGFHVATVDLTGHDVTFAGEGCDRTTLYADGDGTAVTLDAGEVVGMTISAGSGTEIGVRSYGGGVLVTGGDVALTDVCVVGNSATRGGGVAVLAGTATLAGVVAAENSSEFLGGGLYLEDAAGVTVLRSRFVGNVSTGSGGAVAFDGGTGTFTNTVFAGNHCAEYGCGVWSRAWDAGKGVFVGATATLENCTFHANVRDVAGTNYGVAVLAGSSAFTIRNSIFSGHLDPYYVVDKADTQTGAAAATLTTAFLGFRGNAGTDTEYDSWLVDRIAAEPRYVLDDPALPPVAWDLRLRAGSGFVDVGDAALLDPDGSRSDVGAYGGPGAADGWDFGLVADDDADGLLDGWEVHRGTNAVIDDAGDDPDGDGVTHTQEQALDADPFAPDTDGDGVFDGIEVSVGTDPVVAADQAPTADAGVERLTMVGEAALFDGTSSFDPNGDALTYTWSIVSAPYGAAAALVGATTDTATLVPDVPGTWELELAVSDGTVDRTDTVTLRAFDGLVVPDDVATVQEALDAVAAGQGVGVRPGTWVGSFDALGNDVAIVGLGAPDEVVLRGDGLDSVVRTAGGSLTLASLTLEGGWGGDGGGVRADEVDLLELVDVTVRYNRGQSGGGVWADVPDGSVIVRDSRILDNLADFDGGGIYVLGENVHDTLVIERSLVAGNRADDDGGGVYFDGGGIADSKDSDASVFASALADNVAEAGAAWWHSGAGSDTHLWNVALVGNAGTSVVYGNEARIVVMSDLLSANQVTWFFHDDIGAEYQHFDGVWDDLPATPWSTTELVTTLPTYVVADPLDGFVDDGDALDDLFATRAGSPAFDLGFLDHLDLDGTRTDVGPCGGEHARPACARFARDADGDGMSDGWEAAFGLPTDIADSGSDADGDGLSNQQEHDLGTNPVDLDSDEDAVDDATELAAGDDPRDDRDHRPVATVDDDAMVVDVGEIAELSGAGSDPDGDPVAFSWRVISAPPGSAVTTKSLVGATTASPSFAPDIQGGYRVGLVVTGSGASREQVVWVRAPVTVQVPGDYATIEEAVAGVASGMTIHVGPGVWPVTVSPGTKAIGLVGDGVGVTVLEAVGTEPVINLVSGGDVRVRDLTLTGGATIFGGAVECNGGQLEAERVLVTRNLAYTGGALYLFDCETVLVDVDFVENHAASQGAAIYAKSGTLSYLRGTLAQNQSKLSGAGMYLLSIEADLTNLLFYRNVAESIGGAIAAEFDGSDLSGSIVADHLTIVGTLGDLGAIHRSEAIPFVLTNSLIGDSEAYGFYDGGAGADLTLTNNGWSSNGTAHSSPTTLSNGPTDVRADPRFVAYDRFDGGDVVEDLHLRDQSAMRDAGAPGFDPDGSVEDIGAYGGSEAPPGWDAWFVDGDGDGMPDEWELERGLDPLVVDSADDPDGDGLDNGTEHALDSDPLLTDTDADGVDDPSEVAAGQDPIHGSDNAPAADASSDQEGTVGVQASFVGSGTDPQGDPLGYSWSIVEKPGRSLLDDGDLVNATTATVRITPDTPGRFVLGLVVDDGAGSSEVDTVALAVAGDVLVPEDYASVDDAVEAAATGATVWIGAGSFPLHADLDGRGLTIVGAGRDLTFLDALGSGSVFVVRSDETLTLEDLTVTGGFAGRGGAVHAYVGSTVVVTDCALAGNVASEGGAMYVDAATVTVTGSRIVDNVAGYRGGGVHASSSVVDVQQSLVAANVCPDFGGGIRSIYSQVTATNVVFSDNVAREGGAVYGTGSGADITLDHVTATFNEVTYLNGAVLRIQSSASAVVRDTIAYGNTGGTAFVDNSTSLGIDFSYSVLTDNGVDFTIFGPFPAPVDGVNGMQLGADPALVGLVDDGDWTNDDWEPDPATSAATDQGDPLGSLDPDGSAPDVGAFGGALGAWVP